MCGLSARRVDLDAGTLYVVEARYDAGKWGHGIKSSPRVRPASARSRWPSRSPRPSAGASPSGTPPRRSCSPAPVGDRARRGTRTVLTRYQLRRVYLHAVGRAREQGCLRHLDLRGPHDLRHTFATWLEDAGIPSRVIDEVMGHAAGRGRDGSAIGPVYRHTTTAMRERLTAAIGERLTTAVGIVSDRQ